MIKLSQVFKDYQDSGAANALVNIHAAVKGDAFLTKSGDLVAVMKVKGVDYECLDQGQLENATRQLSAALRPLDEKYRVYQYVIKREQAPTLARRYRSRIVQEASDARRAFLAGRAEKLYTVDLYLVITFAGWRPAIAERDRYGSLLRNPLGLRRRLSVQSQVDVLNQSLDGVLETFTSKVNAIAVQLRDSFAVEVLKHDRGFRFLSTLLNYAPHKVETARLRWNSHVDYQAVNSALECHRSHLKVDDYFVKVLTLKEPPARTSAYVLRGILEIPAEFILVSEWQRQSATSIQRLIRSKSRHFFNSKTPLMTYVEARRPTRRTC